MNGDVNPQVRVSRIGDRLRECREWDEALTQGELGEAVGSYGAETKERRTVGKYERGEVAPPVDFLLGACLVRDASPLWLLTGMEPRRWSDLRRLEGPAGADHLASEIMDTLRRVLGDLRGPDGVAGEHDALLDLFNRLHENGEPNGP